MSGSEIENRVQGGRGIVGYGDGEGFVAGWPEMAYESIRAINHLTSGAEAIPAPTLYRVLGELKRVGHLLPQAMEQLGAGLERSLHEFDVYDRRQEPAISVAQARVLLQAAAQLGSVLEEAQSVIAEQGYRTAEERPETLGSALRPGSRHRPPSSRTVSPRSLAP